MRSSFLPFALPDLDEVEHEHVKSALDSGWITTGPKTRQFEKTFAAEVGADHALAVNSCTAAMHLALEAVGLQAGDFVLTTPYTFAATSEVIRYFDAIPVMVDVEPETLNVDMARFAGTAMALREKTPAAMGLLPPALRSRAASKGELKALLPVHMAGLPCDLDPVYALAEQLELPVIEDAAHAFGTRYQGKPIGHSRPGGWQYGVCFSFYATKTLTTGEGGMICTSDSELADRYRMMSLHGISRDAWKRYTAEGSWYYEILAAGYKYNMTDLAAAVGLGQLTKAERMLQRRTDIARRYSEAFRDMPELQVPPEAGAGEQHAWHLYMLRLNADRLGLDRAQFIDELKARQIGASVHFIPLHIHPYYREKFGYRPEDFPVAYREFQREISLPIYSKMTDADVASVIAAVKDIVVRNPRALVVKVPECSTAPAPTSAQGVVSRRKS